jgi:hypothetical protein
MSLDPEPLAAAIKRNDLAAVRELLRDATEADRRACAEALKSLLAAPDFGSRGRLPLPGLPGPDGEESGSAWIRRQSELTYSNMAFLAASLGLAGGVAVAHIADGRCVHWYRVPDADLDLIAGVLADRRPPWLAELVRRKLCDQFDSGLDAWRLARRLVRLGAIERPRVPEYTTKMPTALHRYAPDRERSPLQELLADPGLLDDEVWRLFTTLGAASSLQACGECRWEDALVTLAKRGRLDRGRLLDACLDAFTRDFPPNQLCWYAVLHDRMNLSPAEMAARAGRYLGLLAADAKPGVLLGQQACGRLLEAGLLPVADFLTASRPALLFPLKTVAIAQLKLVGEIAVRPSFRGPALVAAATAFGNERLDVQQAALGLIARHGGPEGADRAAISELAASLAPALFPQAVALGLGVTSAGRPVQVQRPPAQARPSEKLPPSLDDPAELIRLLTALMEDASDALAVERAMAGAVRLCGLPPAERARLAAPLLKRAGERLREDYDGPFGGREIASDMAGLTLAWGSGRAPDVRAARRVWGSDYRETVTRSGQARTMAGILTARIWEASALAAEGHQVQLLAEPETERGAISPERLLGRLASWTAGSPPRHDLEVALLRLPPGLDDSFWSAWERVHPSSLHVARRAYRQRLAPLSLTPEVGLPDPPGPFAGPGRCDPLVLARICGLDSSPRAAEATGSRCWALLTALSRPLRDFSRHYGERWEISSTYQAVVAGWPLLCPWQPELAAAHLLRPLSEGLRPGSTWAGTAATAVRGLAVSGQALGEIGHLALVTGLASAEPYVRLAAAEVWDRACIDGRLDPGLAARAITVGVAGGAFKLNRVADGLRHASPEPAAGPPIVATVFAAADALIPAKPAGLHLLLEAAAMVSVAAGLPDPPDAITRLAAGKDRSRLAAAARYLTPSTR